MARAFISSPLSRDWLGRYFWNLVQHDGAPLRPRAQHHDDSRCSGSVCSLCSRAVG